MANPTGKSETMLSAVLKDHAQARYGSLGGLIEQLGIEYSTLSRWGHGQTDPSEGSLRRLAKETGKPEEDLERLAGMTVEKACELVLRDDPVEQDLRERFTGIVQDRGESVPVAAYAVFITGDTATRAALVGILEEHPDDIPASLNVETLRFALDVADSSILSQRD
jgi:transcriptional regulator with XRE-family HTH domain